MKHAKGGRAENRGEKVEDGRERERGRERATFCLFLFLAAVRDTSETDNFFFLLLFSTGTVFYIFYLCSAKIGLQSCLNQNCKMLSVHFR
jgi:hypothetical protein